MYFVDHNTKTTTWMDPRVAARRRQDRRAGSGGGTTPTSSDAVNGLGNTRNGATRGSGADGGGSQDDRMNQVPSYSVNSSRMSDDSNSSEGRPTGLSRGDNGHAAATRGVPSVTHSSPSTESRFSVDGAQAVGNSEGTSPQFDKTIVIQEGQLGSNFIKKQSDLLQVFPPPAGAFAAATVGTGGTSDDGVNKELQMRLRRYFAPILVRDDAASGCFQCNSKFGVLRRRVSGFRVSIGSVVLKIEMVLIYNLSFLPQHHCKLCGNVFCAECTTSKVNLPIDGPGYEQKQPVCQRCFRNVEVGDYYSFIGLRRLLDDPTRTVDEVRHDIYSRVLYVR